MDHAAVLSYLGSRSEPNLHAGDVQGTIGHYAELDVIPLQPLPILLPLDTRLGIPAHSAWQPHGGAQCQRLVGWSLEDDSARDEDSSIVSIRPAARGSSHTAGTHLVSPLS